MQSIVNQQEWVMLSSQMQAHGKLSPTIAWNSRTELDTFNFWQQAKWDKKNPTLSFFTGIELDTFYFWQQAKQDKKNPTFCFFTGILNKQPSRSHIAMGNILMRKTLIVPTTNNEWAWELLTYWVFLLMK